ncbi:TadE/TadG family type IV pilus assembly protein [Acidisphaera sp. S103]|uniref:TadE/TadG family type IV pilus assembly protein n=1 Tax=Acidisphaera sp. S103 TaxID=1747223 RepID=UPI001C202405|nr:TadE/TadG family type IV pilus assembly protein [Acidisphaera sp. S103]
MAFRRGCRAVAAVEFALIVPVLMVILAGAADFGFREWNRSCLANAVAQGAYYAFVTGPTVSTTAVQTMVQSASSLTGVTVSPVAAVACYCPTGTPAVLGPAVTPCTKACPGDGTLPAGILPGKYLVITASYKGTSIIPAYSILQQPGGETITETAIVRLQ